MALKDYGTISLILKELVNDSDYDEVKNNYARFSVRKTVTKPHRINLKHVEEALEGIININSGEFAIKKYREVRISGHIGVSKQADEIRRMVGDFIPEELKIKATYTNSGGAQPVEVTTKQFKDYLTIMAILGGLPAYINPGYKGKLR